MNVASGIASGWFPRAAESERRAKPFPCGVCEPPPASPVPFTERHLQCVWADDRLRPQALATAAGERVQVEHPGEWNTGPGPDFLNAALLVGPELRRLTGDVEIHIRPADWQRHRHADDPRYRRVCAHVAFYPGTLPDAELPAGALQIALRPALDALPDFSFDNIDLMAYPVAARATPPPRRAAMARLSPAQRGATLDAAGETRLRRRAELLQSAMLDRGPAQVLYEEVMAALGYRPNKAPFRRLAPLHVPDSFPFSPFNRSNDLVNIGQYAFISASLTLPRGVSEKYLRGGPASDGTSRDFRNPSSRSRPRIGYAVLSDTDSSSIRFSACTIS